MKASEWYRSAEILYFYKNIIKYNNKQLDQVCYQLLHNETKQHIRA